MTEKNFDKVIAFNTQLSFFKKNKFIYLFLAVLGLCFCARPFSSCGSRCVGLSLLQSTGSRRAGSAVVAHGPSCSAARGILPDQGSNPCPLHWQADSQPLRHQGSPQLSFVMKTSPGCPQIMGLFEELVIIFQNGPKFIYPVKIFWFGAERMG